MRMDYPDAVLEKAKRLEQLLHRVTAGEPLDKVSEALGLELDQERLARAQAKYEAGGCRWEALVDGRFGHAQKVHSEIREWLYTRKERDEDVRAPQLAREVKEKFGVEVDPGHINYLLRKRGLTAPPGRPYKKKPASQEATEAATAPSESIDNAGVFFPGGCEGGNGGGGSH
jgi:transposase